MGGENMLLRFSQLYDYFHINYIVVLFGSCTQHNLIIAEKLAGSLVKLQFF